jgi:hypothetical protein
MDIPCAVCGELYEAYGIFHGDLNEWEKDLFLAGAGCPCCEGISDTESAGQTNAIKQATVVGIHGAWDNPYVFATVTTLIETDSRFIHPEYKRPSDPVVWECAGCRAQVLRDLDEKVQIKRDMSRYTGYRTSSWAEGLYWRGGKWAQMHHHTNEWDDVLRLSVGDDANHKPGVPKERQIDDGTEDGYCPACAEECNSCGKLTLADDMRLPHGKYGNGDAICSDCYAEIPTCSECGYEFCDDEDSKSCPECDPGKNELDD